jgi:2-hydroxy-3-oxopropionate reductase
MQAQTLFNACAAMGGQGWDHSAMVKALEAKAGFAMGAVA